MTEAEAQQLRELGADIAAAMESPWQPLCVARAFGHLGEGTIALTMQGWIELEGLRSPLLFLELPLSVAELEAAANAFALSIARLSMEEAVFVAEAMRDAVRAAFAMALPMRPHAPSSTTHSQSSDGFGAWLPLFAFLVAECGLTPEAARAIRVDQAFALLAACRRNQGWETAGTPYALRDLKGNEISEPESHAPAEKGDNEPTHDRPPGTAEPSPSLDPQPLETH